MSDTITGTTVADRYRITGYLRAGRMGDIYVARRLEDGQRVSIKLLDPALFYNPEAVKRFARESRIARSIDHPASMQVLDVGRDDIGPYLVMEYVEGDFLSDVLAEGGPLDPLRAAQITGRIAMALEAAHRAGVIHRDLASANVLVATQGDRTDIVKVTDFGLSQLTGMAAAEDEEELTAVGVRIGTPSYMAPEYIQEFELDHRADIYGLGVMLYEMLTGELPFQGRPYAVMDQHVHAPRPRPSDNVPAVPAWLDDLVVDMMAIDPDQRVQSAREVITRVELALGKSLDAPRYVADTAEPAPPRAPALVRETARPLERLITSHLINAERVSGPAPGPDRLFVVARVARTSVAAHIGVSPGWRVHLPDEDTGTGLLDPQLPDAVAERRYVFYPPGGAAPLGARTTGIDLGMQLLRSPANVAAVFDPQNPDADALLDLWRQARWTTLEELALKTVTREEDVAALMDPSALVAYLGSDRPRHLDHPALVLLGAAQYEQGRRAEGVRLVRQFRERHAEGWPAVFTAIAELYAGLEQLEEGHAEAATEHFERSARIGWLARSVARYQEVTRTPLDLTPLVGQPFPAVVLGQGHEQEVTLASELADLVPPQLLTLCVLGAQGGNADYDAFVGRYVHLSRHLSDRFARLRVVTSAPVGGVDTATPAQGVDIQILHDERAEVHRAVQPTTLPTVYVVDASGNCVHQGLLTSCDAWDALAWAERLR